ncbi:hypothetical protein [Novosphingobium sp.]|uniref:hypothetical protein n=1 Tax=Novosphingobium sp. TaxID=1874826 RepID=UPI00333E9EE4
MSGRGILDADMQTVRGWITNGWRWWIDELAGLVPARLRQTTARRLTLMAYDPAQGVLEPVPAADGRAVRSGAPVAVVLPVGLTLIRTITTPQLPPRDVASLIALDADRIMPIARGDVLLGSRINPATSDTPAGRLSVEVAGLPRASAQALAQVLANAPRAPACVLVSAPEPGQPPPIDLLPALRRAGLAGAVEQSPAPFWLAAGFLFALNIGLLVWRDTALTDNLAAVVDQQQPAVNVAHGILTRMGRDDAIATATIAARQHHEPLALLARITAALPAGTWLQRFTWEGTSVRLAGFHPAKTDVPGALRKAGLAVARYGDTSNAAPTPLGEPFEITLKLGKP